MDLSTFHPVFLILALLKAGEAHVEPPTNVTFHCHNVHNVLKWSYNQLLPGMRFRVDIQSTNGLNGHPNEVWVEPPAPLQADVSFLSDPSNDYFLTVTAVIGQNESDSAPEDGITFTYFKDSPVKNKCSVDFPSVNVTTKQDDTILLRFTHPWLVYYKSHSLDTKPRKKKHFESEQQLPMFSYDVVFLQEMGRHHRMNCLDSVCEEVLSVNASQKKHCLKVKGEVNKILVKAAEFCTTPLDEGPSYLIYVSIAVALSVLCAVAVIFMLYRKKTTPSTPLPSTMTFTNKLKQWTFGVVQDTVSLPQVEPTTPTLLLLPEEIDPTTIVTPSMEPEVRLPIGLPTENEGVSDDVEVGNDEGPGYMAGRGLEEEEELCSRDFPSGYEKRPVLVELAPDELAEGYRG
uniref:interferon gamma receptor 1-like n=1 Tax=Epinephelus lanceolatus TaxID=310571 RepID=UPI00144719E0|nr:interferon gamma receptor 1-like [Epinephelus lanceolatus]